MHIQILKHQLIFKQASGTSRGVLTTKDSWMLKATNDIGVNSYGEASIIKGLSPDDTDRMDGMITAQCNHWPEVDLDKLDVNFPSIKFAIEMLKTDFQSDVPFQLFDNDFSRGDKGIPINGLIWMGEKDYMFAQIKAKLNQGFKCLKLKIGAIDFEDELELLAFIRSQFNASDVELRVDANGAFDIKDARTKIEQLSKYQLHSIEQPIKQGQWESMAELCEDPPFPIALDEELIGVTSLNDKIDLLETINPQYIILKPSLVGGWKSSEEWINLAQARNIGWWATSALESNIGLNAIAKWVGSLDTTLPQGLGTGGLYTNNIVSPLVIRDASLWYDKNLEWDTSFLK